MASPNEPAPAGRHTWSQAAENAACDVILLVAFLAVLVLCGYSLTRPGR